MTREELIQAAKEKYSAHSTKSLVDKAKEKWGNRQSFINNVEMKASENIQKAEEAFKKTTPEYIAKQKGPDAVKRLEQARAMPWYEKLAKGAYNETQKLAAGSADLMDTAIGMSGIEDMVYPKNIYDGSTPYRQKPKGPIQRQAQRAIDQKAIDTNNFEFNQESGIPGFLGATVPYMVAEAAIGPKIAKYVGKGIKAVSDDVVDVAKEGGSAVMSGVDNLAHSGFTPLRDVATSVRDRYMKPIKDFARRISGQKKWGDLTVGQRANSLIGGTILGGIEGGLHYDNSMAGGALSSFAGGVVGNKLNPYLTKKVNLNSPAQQETIDAMAKKHYIISPAVALRSKRLQDIEKGLRNETNVSADYIKSFDDANQQINNEIAYQAMGIPKAKAAKMTPKEFKTHLDSIGKEYDDLVSGTEAHFSRPNWEKFKENAAILKSEGNANIVKDVDQIVGNLERAARVTRNPATGRFSPASFNGKTFQRERRRIKAKLDKAYSDGDKESVDAFLPMLKEMDDAIERGMLGSGKVSAAQWKDINERNAMSEILINHGLDKHGDVAPSKLSTYFNKDMKRLLTGQGGRIKDLHLIAKMDDLEKGVTGQSLTGLNLKHDNQGRKSLVDRLIYGNITSKILPGQKQAMKLYMSGFPVETGLLNMNRTGLYSPSAILRSANQASKLHPLLLDKAQEVYDFSQEQYNKLME